MLLAAITGNNGSRLLNKPTQLQVAIGDIFNSSSSSHCG
jgi:hypothetical protein